MKRKRKKRQTDRQKPYAVVVKHADWPWKEEVEEQAERRR